MDMFLIVVMEDIIQHVVAVVEEVILIVLVAVHQLVARVMEADCVMEIQNQQVVIPLHLAQNMEAHGQLKYGDVLNVE